jgi:hypothetical protein
LLGGENRSALNYLESRPVTVSENKARNSL